MRRLLRLFLLMMLPLGAAAQWSLPVDLAERFPRLAAGSEADSTLSIDIGASTNATLQAPADGVVVYRGLLSPAEVGYVIRHANGIYSVLAISQFWKVNFSAPSGASVKLRERLGEFGTSLQQGIPITVRWSLHSVDDERILRARSLEVLTVPTGSIGAIFRSVKDVIDNIRQPVRQLNTLAVAGLGVVRFEVPSKLASLSSSLTLDGQPVRLTHIHTYEIGAFVAKQGLVKVSVSKQNLFKTQDSVEVAVQTGTITEVRLADGIGPKDRFFVSQQKVQGRQAVAPTGGSIPAVKPDAPVDSYGSNATNHTEVVGAPQVSKETKKTEPAPATPSKQDPSQASNDLRWNENWAKFEAWRLTLNKGEPQATLSGPLNSTHSEQSSPSVQAAQVTGTKRQNEPQVTTHSVSTVSQQTEREQRLTAELEASRRRQQELQEEVARERERVAAVQAQVPNQSASQVMPIRSAHALVIGNAAYPGSSRLDNPVNDANAISQKLHSMGFTVTTVTDANRQRLVQAMTQFRRTASSADLSVLFYSGHGVQIFGQNYILPTDVDQSDVAQATIQGVSLNNVVESFLPGKTKLVFLDACRDNPLQRTSDRSVSKGLAPISVAQGTLIAYATKDGQTASDGPGQKNSPFTQALLQHLSDPSDIGVVLRRVREKVMQATGGKQQPWDYGSLTGGELVLSRIGK